MSDPTDTGPVVIHVLEDVRVFLAKQSFELYLDLKDGFQRTGTMLNVDGSVLGQVARDDAVRFHQVFFVAILNLGDVSVLLTSIIYNTTDQILDGMEFTSEEKVEFWARLAASLVGTAAEPIAEHFIAYKLKKEQKKAVERVVSVLTRCALTRLGLKDASRALVQKLIGKLLKSGVTAVQYIALLEHASVGARHLQYINKYMYVVMRPVNLDMVYFLFSDMLDPCLKKLREMIEGEQETSKRKLEGVGRRAGVLPVRKP